MAEDTDIVALDDVQALVGSGGYEVSQETEGVLRIRDLDSGIVIRSVLEDNILFNTVSCLNVASDRIGPEQLRAMLAADNGISTSSFQLYDRDDGTTSITLNNFCKLQALGADDRDDILSCLEFLVVDVCMARDLLDGLG